MLFFQRLFAAYYFLLLKIRKRSKGIFKDRDQDFGALCLVLVSQMFLFTLFLFIIKGMVAFDIPKISKGAIMPEIITLLILGIWLYFGNRYFLSNRERRNRIIDSFRELSNNRKSIWNLIAFSILLTPVWALIFIFFKKIKHL